MDTEMKTKEYQEIEYQASRLKESISFYIKKFGDIILSDQIPNENLKSCLCEFVRVCSAADNDLDKVFTHLKENETGAARDQLEAICDGFNEKHEELTIWLNNAKSE